VKTDKAKLRVIGGRKATDPQKEEDSRVAEVESNDSNRILLASVLKEDPVFYLEPGIKRKGTEKSKIGGRI